MPDAIASRELRVLTHSVFLVHSTRHLSRPCRTRRRTRNRVQHVPANAPRPFQSFFRSQVGVANEAHLDDGAAWRLDRVAHRRHHRHVFAGLITQVQRGQGRVADRLMPPFVLVTCSTPASAFPDVKYTSSGPSRLVMHARNKRKFFSTVTCPQRATQAAECFLRSPVNDSCLLLSRSRLHR